MKPQILTTFIGALFLSSCTNFTTPDKKSEYIYLTEDFKHGNLHIYGWSPPKSENSDLTLLVRPKRSLTFSPSSDYREGVRFHDFGHEALLLTTDQGDTTGLIVEYVTLMTEPIDMQPYVILLSSAASDTGVAFYSETPKPTPKN